MKRRLLILVVMVLLIPTFMFIAFKGKETKVTNIPKITYNAYVQSEENSENYILLDEKDFEIDEYTLVNEKSICTGIDGKIKDADIWIENGEIKVATLYSVNCDLYFNLN